ncbi:MAG: hypothetical protein GYA87_03640 [Christensenellaceae bacterium]|nr:hypothetical protein [Christensenellaceae bacterium]
MKKYLAKLIILAITISIVTNTAYAEIPEPSIDAILEIPVISDNFKTIEIGDKTNIVLKLKRRLKALGYIEKNVSLSGSFTESTADAIKKVQETFGFEVDGIASPEIQTFIFSKACLPLEVMKNRADTVKPIVKPDAQVNMPNLTEDGFLDTSEGKRTYKYENLDDGHWLFINDSLFIEIKRYADYQMNNYWMETEIKTKGDTGFKALFTANPKKYAHPIDIAEENNAVLAFTDDFFYRRSGGVVIRDGEVYRDKKYGKYWPPGDILAIFNDGSMKAYEANEVKADELLSLGAVHSFSFGPMLVSNGEINPKIIDLDSRYNNLREPRNAIGMISPNHYFLITADGRTNETKGSHLNWMAYRMHQVGVTEALNLDGGGTTALIFLGKQLNHVNKNMNKDKNSRHVNSLMAIGEYN